jgi:serine phosphatase RsbU (regulator of sigma subunit)
LHGLDICTRYYAARTGGDFFDAVSVPPYVLFLLTDIAGTHARAQPILARIQDTLRRDAAKLFGLPGVNITDAIATLAHAINHAIFEATNQPAHSTPGEAANDHHLTVFSPTFLGCFDINLGLLAYINAGGLPALFRDHDGTRPLGNSTIPLGLFTHLTFEPVLQVFEPEARLLVVTRGIVEAHRDRTPFGIERLSSILASSPATASSFQLAETAIQQAHMFQRSRWPLLQPFFKSKRLEDLTALVLQRPV